MRATWVGDVDNCPAWAVINVKCKAPGFGKGFTKILGIDNTNPAEFFEQTENRIANRFETKVEDLILEIVDYMT